MLENQNKNLSLRYMKFSNFQEKQLKYIGEDPKKINIQYLREGGFQNKKTFIQYVKSIYNTSITADRAESKRKKYSVTFTFTKVIKRGDSEERVEKSVTKILTSKQKSKKNIDKYAMTVEENQSVDNPSYLIGIDDMKASKPVPLSRQPPNQLMNTPMRNIMIEDDRVRYNSNGFLMSDIDTRRNMCVVDYLLYKYNNPDKPNRRRIKKLTLEKIKQLAFHCDDGDTSSCDLEEGLDVSQIGVIMKFIRCAFIAVNFDLKVFHKWKPEDSGLKRNTAISFTMIFMVQNRHFYPIECDDVRKNIMNQAYNYNTITEKIEVYETDLESRKIEISDADKEKTILENKNIIINPPFETIEYLESGIVILDDTSDSMSYFCDLMRRNLTLRNKDLRCDEGGLKQIKINNNLIIYTNKDYQRVKINADIFYQYLKQNGFKFDDIVKYLDIENKSLTSIALSFYNDNFTLKKSTCNKQVKDIFNSDLCKIRAFRDCFKTPTNKSNVVAIDKNKSYMHALYTNKYDFPVFTPYDKVEPYDDKGYDRPGMFFITTDNYFPLVKNHWYNSSALQMASERGIEFEVKYQIIASDSIKCDHFNKYIDLVKDKCTEDYKLIINSFIGCLNKVKQDFYEINFTTDYKQACDYFFNNENIYIQTEYINDDEMLYVCKKKQTQIYEEHSQSIYNQILLNAHFDLYDQWQQVGGEIIQIKTDCMIIENAKPMIPNNEFGGYKYEKPPTFYKIKYFDGYDTVYKFDNRTWANANTYQDLLEQRKSFFINGMAGTGKSYTINKICESLDAQNISYVKLAPTNKAALNIGGQTIHKAFGIKDGKCMQKKLQSLGKVGYVIIDEYSMITLQIYNMLLILKSKYPRVKFIFAGDSNQLPPIEDVERTYENSRLFMELCEFNQIKLTKNMRSDSILFDVHTRLLNGEDVKNDFKKNKLCRKNICFYNKTVDAVNKIWMDKESDGVDEDEILSVAEMFLTINAPLICKKNNKSKKLYNNGEYYLSDFDDDNIYIQDESNHDDDEIQLTYKEFEDYIKAGYAMTAHCSQGCTITEEYAIYDWEAYHSTVNWRYVAISRSTSKDNIYINEINYIN